MSAAVQASSFLAPTGARRTVSIMMNFPELAPPPSDLPVPRGDQLRLAVAAYLARFKGSSRYHTDSDLRCYLAWCAERGLGPAGRAPPAPRAVHPVDAGNPPVQAIDGVPAALGDGRVLPDLRLDGLLEHSPAEHVRRPSVPAESPTLGFTHLQFEALLTAARESSSSCDFALVAILGLLGLRIFEATGADITDLGEEHGHRVLRVCGKGTKIVLVPLPPAVGRAIDKAIGGHASGPVLLNSPGARMDRPAATRPCGGSLGRLRAASHQPPTPTCSGTRWVTTMLDAGVDLREGHPHRLMTSGQGQEGVTGLDVVELDVVPAALFPFVQAGSA